MDAVNAGLLIGIIRGNEAHAAYISMTDTKLGYSPVDDKFFLLQVLPAGCSYFVAAIF